VRSTARKEDAAAIPTRNSPEERLQRALRFQWFSKWSLHRGPWDSATGQEPKIQGPNTKQSAEFEEGAKSRSGISIDYDGAPTEFGVLHGDDLDRDKRNSKDESRNWRRVGWVNARQGGNN